MEHTQTQTQSLVVMMASPGLGHLIPMLEFAKRLVVHGNLVVAFLIPTYGAPSNAQNAVVRGLPASISHVFLSPVATTSNLPNPPPDAKPVDHIVHTVLRSLSPLRDAFRSLMASHGSVFGIDAFAVADEFNVPSYIFHVSTAMTLAFFFHLPELDESFHSKYRDLPEPVRLPGCVPVQGRDLVEPVQDCENNAYKLILRSAKHYRLAKGIIFNSFIDLEPEAIKELQKEKSGRPPVYPVGPLVNVSHAHNDDDGSESECLKWLDEQPRGSVLFVSFGSGWSHTSAQLKEIAQGLEMSEERFMWVVRSPNDKQADAFSAKAETQTDHLFETLPEGFVERTKGRGLLVTSWAPQAKILSHGSTGGFVSHSGWNSVLESMVNGVPLVVWPMYAEQKMNATFLTEDIKVAVRPEVNESSGLVEREEIARVVKGLMRKEEGNEVRLRMKKLKEATANAYGENGCSTKQIARLALMWNNKII